MANSPENSVRGLGMGCGVFLMALAALFATIVLRALASALASVDVKGALSNDAGVIASFSVFGIAFGLYGRSLFRRARTDKVVTTTAEVPQEGDHTALAWVALVFGSLLVVAIPILTWLSMAPGKIPNTKLFFLPTLIVMPISAGRYLLRRRAANRASAALRQRD